MLRGFFEALLKFVKFGFTINHEGAMENEVAKANMPETPLESVHPN